MGLFRIRDYTHMLNDIVINSTGEVGRFVGFHYDLMDVYYVVRRLGGKDLYSSCVGGIESLKSLQMHPYLDSVHCLNRAPPVTHMEITRRTKEYQNEWYFENTAF